MDDGAARTTGSGQKISSISVSQRFPIRQALVGAVLGIDAIGLCLALATICFSGALIGGLGLATAVFLASTGVMTLVLVRFSAFRNAVSVTQDTAIAILAPAVAIAGAGAVGGETEKIATAFAVIGLATILSGAAFVFVGALGLGRIVRLVPYPVAAGFLASSGWLLVLSAMLILTNSNSVGALFVNLQDLDAWMALIPALILAAALVATVRFGGGSLGFVFIIATAVALFHAYLWLSGMGFEGARAAGLLQRIASPATSQLSFVSLFTAIDLSQVLLSTPILMAVVIVNLIGFLLNVSGVELAARRDINVNRELKFTGLTNLAIGSCGAATNFMTSGSTTVAQKIATSNSALGISYAAVLLVGCVFSHQIISLVPIFVAAGLLVFIGFSMISDWLFGTRKKLNLSDWLIVLAIVAVTILVGILSAIVFGLVLAIFSFAVGYARLPVIRNISTGLQRRSTLDRSVEEEGVLQAFGGRIRILKLQGYLFFGSIERLIDQLRSELDAFHEENAATGDLILDFASVTGIDSAGCSALGKLAYVAHNRGFNVHLAALPESVLKTINRWRLDLSGESGLKRWPTVDSALEACETAVLDIQLGKPREFSVRSIFEKLTRDHPRTEDVLQLMTPMELRAGDILIRQGTTSGDIFVLESGRLAVTLNKSDSPPIKLRSLSAGSIVGEAARYRGRLRTANVTAEIDSKVYCLSEVDLDRIEGDDRDLAALIHAMLASALAEKVAQTNSRVLDH